MKTRNDFVTQLLALVLVLLIAVGTSFGEPPPDSVQVIKQRLDAQLSRFAPSLHGSAVQPEQVEQAPERVIHHGLETVRLCIEGGHRRCYHGAELRESCEHPQMTGVERSFPDHEHKPAALLERHVGGAA